MQNALIILAGGYSQRFGTLIKIPKQYIKIGSTNIIGYFLDNLDKNIFDIIVIVCDYKMKKKYLSNIKNKYFMHNIYFSKAGINRQDSSKKGVYFLNKFKPKNVLIHDAARPLASNNLIKRLIKKLNNFQACASYNQQQDYIKYKNDNVLLKNDDLKFIQTPQAFIYKYILKAHKKSKNINAKDDTILTEKIGIKTKLIKGSKKNIKITYKEDLDIFSLLKRRINRSGIGYDIHKINFNSKKKLTLCGVKINYAPLIGHSDADVGYHAICDSILGALSMRDIGYYFNNKNNKWKNANSKIFMQFCYNHLKIKKFNIVNLDINFICENPKINKYIKEMKRNISRLLNITTDKISIKATTNEKIKFIGNAEGIAAESIIQIQNE